jgi:tetratricopeptide (TPR) repeat protein
LVPEVLLTRSDLPRPSSMMEGWQRQRFFEALAHAVHSARQPLLLLLDDMHWCDQESLTWLQYLLHFDPGARLLLIGTVRAEEILPSHPLVVFQRNLQRDGLVREIALGPLTRAETTTLAEHVVGRKLDPAVASGLYAETEGNPLFVVEMMRAGTLAQDMSEERVPEQPVPLFTHAASTLPPTVQSVLAARLAQLSHLARGVANVAAVIGREFTFSVLAQASREPEEAVMRGLDELWQRRIVREQDAGTSQMYDFSHDKLREQVYASVGPTYRPLLHRRVAEALRALYVEDLDAVSGQIAAHYERAGFPEQAIQYYQRAGEVARHIYANAEAIHQFRRAAALLEVHSPEHPQREVLWETAAQVYESLGDVLSEIGRYEEASRAYHRALLHVPIQAPLWQARLQRKVARSWRYISTNLEDTAHANARLAFQEAQRILTDASDPSSPTWRHEWIELQFAQIWQTWPLSGSEEDMMAAIELARPVVEQYGTDEQRELLSYALAVRDLIHNRYRNSVSEQQISSRLAALAALEQTGNKSRIGRGHFGFGVALLWSGYLSEAEEHLSVARRIAEQIGSTILQMRCLTFLPFVYRRRGQVEQVRSILTQAQAIGAVRNNTILAGHRAWVAWRDGNLVEAESYGRAAVKNKPSQRNANPLQWVGLWPLIGVALVQENMTEAMTNVRLLLDPSQQPPPEHLEKLLSAALCAWDTGGADKARALLQQAAPHAEQMGYL